MVSGTMSEDFRSLGWKLCLWHAFAVHASSTWWWLGAFVKGITSYEPMGNRVISYSLTCF